ncbi:hypothetical protein ABIB17_003598 [Arthrobacter sp. UYEF6]
MGLNHTTDLAAWHRWQQSRSPLRMLKNAARKQAEPSLYLSVRGENPRILVALDSTKPTSIASYMRPLTFLPDNDLAVLAPADVSALLPGEGWRTIQAIQDGTVPNALRHIAAVLAAGNYLPVSAAAHQLSKLLGARFLVVQHGLMTPHAPPLPEDGHLLAFSTADAAFWSSGRQDVTFDVVGSQLLWEAAKRPATRLDDSERPVFLGQLHGAELPRVGLTRAATTFCTAAGATYRPHPSETDKLSRLQHAWWAKQGIHIDRSGMPLAEVTAPVVSAFSTGVLEAAARGIPSWVTYRRPPRWLEEFWERYDMSRWGSDPTPPPVQGEQEPAAVIARILQTEIGTSS